MRCWARRSACIGRGAGLSLRGCFGTRLAFFLGLLVLAASSAAAQTQTTVSGTVTDPHGLVYAGATISWKLITPGGGTPSITPCSNPGAGCQIAAAGGPFPLAPTTTIAGTGLAAPPAGSFSMALWPNASILPASSTYSFFVSIPGVLPPWGTGAQSCSITGISIAGSSQDIGAALSAVCPPLTPPFGGGTPGSIVCSPGPCSNDFFSIYNVAGSTTNVTNGPCAFFNSVVVCAAPMDVQNNGYGVEKANSASGTTCGLSVSYDASGNAIVTPNGATVGSEGVAVTTQPGVNASGQAVGCGTTGQVYIGQLGNFSLTFDNQTVIRDYITIGANGQFHDAGSVEPTGVQVLGRVTSLNAGAGTNANADIFTGDSVGNNSNSGKGQACAVNGTIVAGKTCNFNGTTPAAAANTVNLAWQTDNSVPTSNVSLAAPVAQPATAGLVELNTDFCNLYTAPNVCGFHGHTYTETSLAAKDVICAISAIAYANCKPGVPPRLVSGTSDTVLSTDRGGWILTTNAGAVAETVPTAASLGGSNFYFNVSSNGGGTVTLTFSGGETVTKNATSAGSSSTLAISSGGWCNITSDTSGTANWYADCGGSAGGAASVTLSVPPELLVNGSSSATASVLNVTKATENPNLVWASPVAQSTSNIVQSGSILCNVGPTCAITTTAGINANDLLIVQSLATGSVNSSISDTLGNTFTSAVTTNSNPSVWFVCASAAGSDTITVGGGTSSFPMIVQYVEATGNATSSCRDASSSTTAYTNNSPGATFNSVTTSGSVSQAAELVFGFWEGNSTVPASLGPGGGFVALQNTLNNNIGAGGYNSIMIEVGTTNQGLSGTQTATASATGNWNAAFQGLVITFKLNTTGNGIPVFRRLVEADLPGHAGTFAYCTNTFTPAAVTGVTVETVFNFACQIPAQTIAAGSRITVNAHGISTMAGTSDTLTIKVKICQVLGCGSGTVVNLGTTGALTPGVTTANLGWHVEDSAIIFTPGTSNTTDAQGVSWFSTSASAAQTASLANSATTSFNDTVLEYVQLSVQPSASGDSVQLRNVLVTAQ